MGARLRSRVIGAACLGALGCSGVNPAFMPAPGAGGAPSGRLDAASSPPGVGGGGGSPTSPGTGGAWSTPDEIGLEAGADAGRGDLAAEPPVLHRADLLGYWPLDDGRGSSQAKDGSGANRHGMLQDLDVQTAWVDGRVGPGALHFPGGLPGAGVRIPIDPVLDGIRSFTISLWLKRLSLPAMAHKSAFSRQLGATDQELFNISCQSTDVIAYIPGPSPQINKEARGVRLVADLEWHHVAATYDGDVLTLYVDGALAARKTGFTNRLVSSTTDVYIGTNKNSGATEPFEGTVDDVALYGKALPASAIDALFKGRSPLSL